MQLVKYFCPHCGASVSVDESKKSFFCMYCGGQIGIDDGVQRTQHEENINIKTEKVVNNIAEVENAKNQGFLYRSRYILIIAGVAVTVLAIFVGIAFGFITALGNRGAGSYKPSHTASKDEVEIDKHTKADFTKVIFGKFEEESNLIVSEQEVKTEWELEKEGLFGWSVFEKKQTIVYVGTAQYTVDLSKIDKSDVDYDEDENELIIYVDPSIIELMIIPDPSKTVVGDPENGWLAWGEIELTVEETNEIETNAINKMYDETKAREDEDLIYTAVKRSLKNLIGACVSSVDDDTTVRIQIRTTDELYFIK